MAAEEFGRFEKRAWARGNGYEQRSSLSEIYGGERLRLGFEQFHGDIVLRRGGWHHVSKLIGRGFG